MQIRGTFLLPSTVTKTLVCIDTVESAEFGGRFYNQYLPDCIEFGGAYDFVNKMEDIFDRFRFPHAFFQSRAFRASHIMCQQDAIADKLICYQDETIFTQQKGCKVTILLQVLTRQHATWQGMALWVEENCSVRFQSVQELLGMIVDTLSKPSGGIQLANWEKRVEERQG